MLIIRVFIPIIFIKDNSGNKVVASLYLFKAIYAKYVTFMAVA